MRFIEEGGGGGAKCFPAGWNLPAKPCDSCKIAAALLFCRTDSAFMCMACDVKLHKVTSAPRHERVWMCEVCELAPASVTCKADAAALCVTCDRNIHSANPLARRHERVSVVPFYETAESVVKTTAETLLVDASKDEVCGTNFRCGIMSPADNYAPTPTDWSLPTGNIAKIPGDTHPDLKSIEFLFSESDQLLDFDYPIPTDSTLHSHFLKAGTDSVVPVQLPAQILDHSPETRFEIDFTKSNISSYNNSYTNHSLSHSISSSSMDVGIVPEGSSMSDISYPFVLQMGNGVDLNGSINGSQATQLSGMDREARVLRYREKRKNRKFEKTIRYASRKAYAETRPRIKGRFAKRTESSDLEVDHWFTSNSASKVSFMRDAEYGVVPSY